MLGREPSSCVPASKAPKRVAAHASTRAAKRDRRELLEDHDPDAEVMIMSQENWPFENAVAGVAVREEMIEDEDDLRDEERQRRRQAERDAARDGA